MNRRPGRPKLGNEVLSRERILATALQLVDVEGVERLSMRRLATALGVDPMAIYRHLPDKATLIAGLVEMVFGEFEVPSLAAQDDAVGWREKIRAFAAAYRRMVRAHPNLLVYVITHVEASPPAILAVGEFLVATLHRAGLAPIQVFTAHNLIIDFLNGFALGESSGRMGEPGEYSELYALLATLPADHYPAMQAILGAFDGATLQARAEDELELILAGIATWLER